MMNERLNLNAAPPHVRDSDSLSKIMATVLLALVPAGIWGVWQFGGYSILIIVASVISAQLTEIIYAGIRKKPFHWDGSACVSGLLLAYTLPPRFPILLAAIGGMTAVLFRDLFGGLGKNRLNPALSSRLVLGWLFPTAIARLITPHLGTISGIEAVTGATPLAAFYTAKTILAGSTAQPTELVAESAQTIYQLYAGTGQYFYGLKSGSIGETSSLFILVGALILLYRRIIRIRTPLLFITTTAVLSWIFGGIEGLFSGDPLFQIFNGGIMLGAFFMATDPVTSPGKPAVKIVYGIGCGVLTFAFRFWMGTEGTCYSILIMNLLKSFLDR
jgi:Na+-translocating ferredoxin:NAD+ oxidoreductase subunit D